MLDRLGFDHPSWLSAVSTATSYLVILAGMFILLFVIPFLIFTMF